MNSKIQRRRVRDSASRASDGSSGQTRDCTKIGTAPAANDPFKDRETLANRDPGKHGVYGFAGNCCDEVETLECTATELKVRVTKYAKYANTIDKAKGVVSPERPTGLVEGDRFDASIGVEVVAWKYFYHLPFYRQQDLLGGSGWTPSRSTLHNIEAAVEFARRPLAECLREALSQDRTVGCDDTGVLLITPNAMPDLSKHPRRERISEVL